MLDNPLFWTVLVIFGAAIVGAVLRYRQKDICLKNFSGYLVYVQKKDGKQVWGELHTASTGIELRYRANHTDPSDGHLESSYIFFKNEFPDFYLVIRFLDELTERNSKRRAKTLKRSYKPGILRRLRRRIRNGFNILRDAIGQAFTAMVSAATKTAAPTLASQQKTLAQTGGQAVEWFGNAYDPILEWHIGKRVVVEVTSPQGERLEYVGVFREYSSDYLEVMDVMLPDGEKPRLVDLIVPRAHGNIRHNSEPVKVKKLPKDEPEPALLESAEEPETTVDL